MKNIFKITCNRCFLAVLLCVMLFINNNRAYAQCPPGEAQITVPLNVYVGDVVLNNGVDNDYNILGSSIATANFAQSNDKMVVKMTQTINNGDAVTVFGNDGDDVDLWVSANYNGSIAATTWTRVATNGQLDFEFTSPINWQYMRIENASVEFLNISLVRAVSSQEICDADTDNDGIGNAEDLDDDNDGILDANELGAVGCDIKAAPKFDSSKGPFSYNGSNVNNPSVGDQFLYRNVYSGVDAIITIVFSNDNGIIELDATSTGVGENFQPYIEHRDERSYTEFRIDFVTANTTTPAPPKDYVLSVIDNDYYEFVTFKDGYTGDLYVDSNTRELPYIGQPANSNGFTYGYSGDGDFVIGIDNATSNYQVFANYAFVSSVSIRFGGGLPNEPSYHSITLDPCVPVDNYDLYPPVSEDTDGDGIPNHLDTDSDNDGCPDAVEASGNIIPSQLTTLSGGSNGGSSDNLGTNSDAQGRAIVNGTGYAQDDTNAALDASNSVACTTDLNLIKTVDVAAPKVGDIIVYTLTVANNGVLDATGVQVTDVLPSSGLSFVSDDSGSTGTSYVGNVWNIGNLNVGASISLKITATVTAEGVIKNTAEVTATSQADIDSIPNNGK
ncbi:DUF11 domain-containing protein [Algibacter pacificus]|uniref:DUF11 domain-containing protein n=1 Tax=Algibacter pacificus TaxID=2599389 RepID=UPI0011CC950E|nr:DUF11 domain-containing protein [Algibacter pacificus]